MVVVVKDRESPLKQRIHAVPSYDNSGPSYIFPALAMLLYPRLSLEHPMLLP